LNIKIYQTKELLGQAAAEHATSAMRNAIRDRNRARVIAATGTSQFEFLNALTQMTGIDWRRVELFHLDEYIGLSDTHPASFRRFLLDRLIHKTGIVDYHLLDGDCDPGEVACRTGELLNSAPVDMAFVGIGENGHLAFNDPPADFQTEEPFLTVELDEACRLQQVKEGWFASLSEVPRKAISMSIRQILKAREILALVPDARKARAVKACCEGGMGPMAPASILREHPNTTVFLDLQSAALLSPETRAQV
jgi:glucosamine-6-phosphate deaminase